VVDPTDPVDKLTFFALAAPLAALWYFGINHLVSGLRHVQAAYPAREVVSGTHVRCAYVRFGFGSPFYLARVTVAADGFSMAPPLF
jgi:hypothetical protein